MLHNVNEKNRCHRDFDCHMLDHVDVFVSFVL